MSQYLHLSKTDIVNSELNLKIAQDDLLSAGENHQVLVGWNQTRTDYSQDKCIHQLFEEQVERNPDSVAVVFESQPLTYEKLNQRANQLAHYLRGLGVQSETLVGICLDRSLEMLVTLLGIMKAGGAYIPIDPSYPADRIASMLEDSRLELLVTQLTLRDQLPPTIATIVDLVQDAATIAQQSTQTPANPATADNLAYVIYTSGSTGNPKGVQIVHSAVVNFLRSMQVAPGITSDDVLLAITTISFDIAVLELFLPLTVGAQIVLADRATVSDALQLKRLFEQAKPTMMQATPATWRMLLAVNWAGKSDLKILCGGEAITQSLAAQLLPRSAQLWNMYGPTETTIWSTIQQIHTADAPITIGLPIANTQVYLLNQPSQRADDVLTQVPIGAAGELYIGGDGLARGYLHRPDLTAERFVANPFSDSSGGRLYRTGDLARYLPDGTLQCMGRVDHQVKIRGHRIELGDIEAALSQSPLVRDTAVVVREDESGEKNLVAYVTENADVSAIDPVLASAVRQDVAQQWAQQWAQIWDSAYTQEGDDQAATFNLSGWNSSYTGQQAPAAELSQWLDHTIDRITELQPRQILEIGCGMGLLLFQLAPDCERYVGTDISLEAIQYLQQTIAQELPEHNQIELFQHPADTLHELSIGKFDTIVINSVVQYFPDADYLVQVLKNAAQLLAPGGRIFIGDVRSLPLLEAFHTSVQLYQAPDTLPVDKLTQRIQQHMMQERELIFDPTFFDRLQTAVPEIAQVQIQLKRGTYQNEFVQFRYDVVLYGAADELTVATPIELNWSTQRLSVSEIRQQLQEISPQLLAIRQISNARMLQELQAIALLAAPPAEFTVGDLRKILLETPSTGGLEPEAIWALTTDLPYDIVLDWSDSSGSGQFDAWFKRRAPDALPAVFPIPKADRPAAAKLADYVNHPLQASGALNLVAQLRSWLKAKLPDYMVPSIFVEMATLPLTPNGKVDRRALPAPSQTRPNLRKVYIAPRNVLEDQLAKLWEDLLQISPIGIDDNFFELGGHSLLATQVVFRIYDYFGVETPLRSLFENPTIAALSQQIEVELSLKTSRTSTPLLPITRPSEIPVSSVQSGLWFLDRINPDSEFYNIPLALRLSGQLNLEALEQSIREIILRHEALRTNFVTVNGQPAQVIAPTKEWQLEIIDLSSLPASRRVVEAQRLATEAAHRPFNLEQESLIRGLVLQIDETDTILFFNIHHIIFDGWSLGVFQQELSELYGAFNRGKTPNLPVLPIQPADFVLWQQQEIQEEDSQLEYWQQHLQGMPTLLELPTDQPRPAIQTFQGATQSFTLPLELRSALKHYSQQTGVTLFMTLLTAFQTFLYRYTGADDIVVGTPVANRNRQELENLIGFFVNTLVLRTDMSGNPTFTELLGRVREVALGAYAHSDLPFEQLVAALQPERSLSYSPLVQVMFAFEDMARANLALYGLDVNVFPLDNQSTKFDLTLSMENTEQGIIGHWEYNTDLFEAETINRMSGHFQALLQGIVVNPEQRISDLPLLTEQECHQVLVEWNQTRTDYPQDKCIHQLFEAQVERTPNAIAVVFEEQQLTYRELNVRANQLAHYLQDLGVQAETLVGICIERSLEMIIGILGILKAGGVYVPLDPAYPQERLFLIVEDANVSIVLTQSQLIDRLPAHQLRPIYLDKEWSEIRRKSNDNLTQSIKSSNLAYVIYTSGSTGNPKGVAVSHQAVNRLVINSSYIDLQPEDVVAFASNFSFDAATFEIWGALLNGAKVIVLNKDILLSPKHFIEQLDKQKVSTLFLTTALFNLLARENPLAFKGLKHLLFGGEAVDIKWVKQVLQQGSPQRFLHVYGPTESTTFATWFPIEAIEDGAVTIPIGRPIANTQAYILDRHLQVVPIGVIGELYIGGDGLARGYLNRPELTAEKFIPSPFSDEPGVRLYKTGDLARYLPDGNIEFLGRIDHQVKIRGFRIELGEIESALTQHPDIREAIVMAREDKPSDKRLVAYLTSNLIPDRLPYYSVCLLELDNNTFKLQTENLSKGGIEVLGAPIILEGTSIRIRLLLPESNEIRWFDGKIAWSNSSATGIQFQLSPAEQILIDLSVTVLMEAQGLWTTWQRSIAQSLRQHLKSKLPDYMIPSAFILMQTMPLTPNGKIDRRALPAPDRRQEQQTENFAAPRTTTELTIARIWQEVLGLSQVSITDNFFELGGHSLLAVQIVSRLCEALTTDISIRTLFESPTIAELSQAIETQKATQPIDFTVKQSTITSFPRDSVIPLSFSQSDLWHTERDYAGDGAANSPLTLKLLGSLSPHILSQSVNEIIRRHEILRTTFPIIDKLPVQKIAPTLTLPLEIITLQHLPIEIREIEAEKILRSAMSHRFDLATASLIKAVLIQLSDDEHWCMILMHHIISDGWSHGIFIQELATLYDAFSCGKPSPLPDPSCQYADFTMWERSYFSEAVISAHMTYWQKHLANLPTSLDLLPTIESPINSHSLTNEYQLSLPVNLTSEITAFRHTHNVTPYAIFLTTLKILLSKWSKQNDILVIGVTGNRITPEIEKLLGCFITDLPVRSQIKHNETLISLIKQVQQNLISGLIHPLPTENFWEPFVGNLRTVHLILADAMKWSGQNLSCEALSISNDRDLWDEKHLPLELYVSYSSDPDQPIEFYASYSTTAFTTETIDLFLTSYQAILARLIRQPETQIAEF